jgi:hypothetical protein
MPLAHAPATAPDAPEQDASLMRRYYARAVDGGWGVFDSLAARPPKPICVVPKQQTARGIAEGLDCRRAILAEQPELAVAMMKATP